MAIEARRGCGYRKVGGIYMMGGKLSAPCCKFPIELSVCPCCGMGVRLTRTWTWIDPTEWLRGKCTLKQRNWICPAADPATGLKAPSDETLRVGLLNIGAGFYTPAEFTREAAELGISRRLQAIPRGFRLGEHWVMLAHPKLKQVGDEWIGGIFAMFKPTAIEKVMTQSQADALTEDERKELKRKQITPFVVPDNDRDHQGSVYDAEPELELV